MNSYRNFVGNAFIDAPAAARLDVLDPATGMPCAQVALADEALAIQTVKAAAAARRDWCRLPAIARGEALRSLAAALVGRADAIGRALAAESGKSPEDARNEVIYAAEITRYHAEWARRIEGEIIPSDSPDEKLFLHREPIGVVACLIPFNFPVYTLLRKIAPALITGNTVVVRPSNNTPCSAFEIAQAVLDAGLPPGVVNILAMDHDTAAVLCTRPEVGMMTLTGSVRAGRQILEYSKVNIARCSLELGGKTPAIIAADADLEAAADAIVRSKLTHCGQLCTAVERVLVHRSVHDRMLGLLRARMAARHIGDRRVDAGAVGPLVSASARAHLHALVERAVADGARLETGGVLPDGPGYFYPPTLLSQCRQEMEVIREETFGPVLCVQAVDSLEEALALANDHQYGLASVLYTADYRSAMRIAAEIEAGELYVNRTPADPYQGYHAGWKRSGLGGDDGKHGMLEFTQTRLVVMPY